MFFIAESLPTRTCNVCPIPKSAATYNVYKEETLDVYIKKLPQCRGAQQTTNLIKYALLSTAQQTTNLIQYALLSTAQQTSNLICNILKIMFNPNKLI